MSNNTQAPNANLPGQKRMLSAVGRGDVAAINVLISGGQSTDFEGRISPLLKALSLKQWDAAIALLRGGADPLFCGEYSPKGRVRVLQQIIMHSPKKVQEALMEQTTPAELIKKMERLILGSGYGQLERWTDWCAAASIIAPEQYPDIVRRGQEMAKKLPLEDGGPTEQDFPRSLWTSLVYWNPNGKIIKKTTEILSVDVFDLGISYYAGRLWETTDESGKEWMAERAEQWMAEKLRGGRKQIDEAREFFMAWVNWGNESLHMLDWAVDRPLLKTMMIDNFGEMIVDMAAQRTALMQKWLKFAGDKHFFTGTQAQIASIVKNKNGWLLAKLLKLNPRMKKSDKNDILCKICGEWPQKQIEIGAVLLHTKGANLILKNKDGNNAFEILRSRGMQDTANIIKAKIDLKEMDSEVVHGGKIRRARL
jgi:hypothetical protein